MELPKRKNIRFKTYDYSSPGTYFITICVKYRKAILSNIVVGASIARPKEIYLTQYGKIVETAINNIPKHYPIISVDNYIIMPDHIHLLLRIHCDANGLPVSAPEINKVIQQTKGNNVKKALSVFG